MSRALILSLICLLSAVSPAQALIEFSIGNDPVGDHHNWPAGSLDVANLESRLGFWVGPPFGGSEHHFEYRGDAVAFQQALDLFAKIDARELRLVIHEGPGESFVLKRDKDNKDGGARLDWAFVVWNPKVYNQLYNDPRSIFSADDPSGHFRQPVAPPRLDVYVGGAEPGAGIDWSRVTVPANVKVTDERASANGYPAGSGSVLRGRVTELGAGKPIAGAKVVVMRYTGKGQDYEDVTSATAGADGKFEATGIPPGNYRIHAAAEGFLPRLIAHANFGKDTLKDYPQVTLAPPATLTGRVVTNDGKPVANVPVRAEPLISSDGRGYIMPDDPRTLTDASGAFTLQLPKGSCQLHANLKALYRLDPLKIHTVPADDVKLVMTATGTVRGKVTQRGGAPTDGEYIAEMTPEGGLVVGSWGGSMTVHADGTFEFTSAPPGKYTVTARPNPGPEIKGKDPNAKDVVVEPGKTVEVEIVVK